MNDKDQQSDVADKRFAEGLAGLFADLQAPIHGAASQKHKRIVASVQARLEADAKAGYPTHGYQAAAFDHRAAQASSLVTATRAQTVAQLVGVFVAGACTAVIALTMASRWRSNAHPESVIQQAVTVPEATPAALASSPPPHPPAEYVGAEPARSNTAVHTTLPREHAHAETTRATGDRCVDQTVQQHSLHGSVDELTALANLCRLAGNARQAERIYRLIRERHPGTANATNAAFFLARLCVETRPDDARQFLLAYRQEAPDGSFAREALGRLLEMSPAGDRTELAEEYLRRFPDGPHHELARLSLQRSSTAAPSPTNNR